MKKILVQLDSDEYPSLFDRIVAYDAGADEVLSYGRVTTENIRGLIQDAFFTRGVSDLKNTAVWIGGSDVAQGERLLAEAQQAFFGPFKVSLMLDSNGCNTTAAAAVVKLAEQVGLSGRQAVIIGTGPVGTRAAILLASQGSHVILTPIPAKLLGDRYNPDLAQESLAAARHMAHVFAGGRESLSDEGMRHASAAIAAARVGDLQVVEIADLDALTHYLEGAEIVITAGPAGLQILPHRLWANHPSLQFLLDFNLTEPPGIEGINPSDDFKQREGKRVLGPLAIGTPKMNVHKACIAQLFERNDLVLDAISVYQVAKQLVKNQESKD